MQITLGNWRFSRKNLGLLAGALCLCVLAGFSHLMTTSGPVSLAYGGYWGGYYDAGYYGAYNNPYAYDVARRDYWDAMNAFDAAGVRRYNDWVEQRRDWDRGGYGVGPYDSQAHADYWRSADQAGWGDQTRYNDYLSSYFAQAGGEYPYGYPSIDDNFKRAGWNPRGPPVEANFASRGGLSRQAEDMRDSNHRGSDLETRQGIDAMQRVEAAQGLNRVQNRQLVQLRSARRRGSQQSALWRKVLQQLAPACLAAVKRAAETTSLRHGHWSGRRWQVR
jgi:hypothetical protein